MTAGAYDFYCEQGATFNRVVTVNDPAGDARDFTNHTGRMSVRRHVSDTTSLIDLTTENGRMSLGSDGTITLSIAAADTSAMADDGFYDLEVEDDSGNVERVLEGRFTLGREVTK